jgi:AcrR family transcriptional regulator
MNQPREHSWNALMHHGIYQLCAKIQTYISNIHLNLPEQTMHEAKKKGSTRTRLLDAAAQAFARKGFTDTTVAEICDEADANIAAVNYHFGSKEELYQASWLHAFNKAMPAKADNTHQERGQTPEEHLRFHIGMLIRRIADPANCVFDIMEHEFANPTGLLREIIAKELAPHKLNFNSHIAQLLGEDVPQEAIDLCRASIIAQCFHLKKLQRLHETHGDLANFVHLDAATYSEHVYRFSLGGIEAVRKELNS